MRTKKQLRIQIESIFKEMEKAITDLPTHGYKRNVFSRLSECKLQLLKLCRFWVFRWPRYKDPQMMNLLLSDLATNTDFLCTQFKALADIIDRELPHKKGSLGVLIKLVGIIPQINIIYRYKYMRHEDEQ